MDDLDFLVGCWRGTGTWGGRPFACRTRVQRLPGRTLRIDVHASQEGRADHEERVIVHEAGDRLVATLSPDRGEVQVFDVQVTEPGAGVRFVFTPPAGSALSPQRWTIRRSERGYDETFEIAPGGGAFQTSVTCSYEAAEEESAQ